MKKLVVGLTLLILLSFRPAGASDVGALVGVGIGGLLLGGLIVSLASTPPVAYAPGYAYPPPYPVYSPPYGYWGYPYRDYGHGYGYGRAAYGYAGPPQAFARGHRADDNYRDGYRAGLRATRRTARQDEPFYDYESVRIGRPR